MIYIDLRQPNLAAEKCEEIDNGNGTKSYRKTSNGKIFCVTDEGAIEERDAPGGSQLERQADGIPAAVRRGPLNGCPPAAHRRCPFHPKKGESTCH
jgi:hypothetical protein